MAGPSTDVVAERTGRGDPLVVVTSDSHVSPTLDTLRDYCPKGYRSRFDDYLEETAAMRSLAAERFVFGGDDADPEVNRIHTWNFQTHGHHDIHARLRDMDRDGVAAEVIFHGSAPFEPLPFTMVGFGVPIGDPELPPWVSTSITPGSPTSARSNPSATSASRSSRCGTSTLPSPRLEWAAEAGLGGVNFPAPRDEITPFEDPAWEPFWAACVDLDMTLANHGAGGATTPLTTGPAANYIYMAESGAVQRLSPLVRLVLSGVFERHPEIKLVQTERAGEWYGPVLTDLDSLWERFNYALRELCPKAPSEYCRDSYFVGASFQAHFEAEAAVRDGYTENILWGSDYPHPEGTYHFQEDESATPMTRIAMRSTYAGLPADATTATLGENAVRVYGLDAGALRTVADRIGAPTLDELAQPVEERPDHWGMAFRTTATYT